MAALDGGVTQGHTVAWLQWVCVIVLHRRQVQAQGSGVGDEEGIDLRGLQVELRDPEVGKTMMSEAALVRLMKGMVTLATGEGSPRGT